MAQTKKKRKPNQTSFSKTRQSKNHISIRHKDLRACKNFSAGLVTEWVNALSIQTGKEISATLKDPAATNLERLIAQMWRLAIKSGDTARANFLFDRSIGKVASQVTLNKGFDFSQMTDEEIEQKRRELAQKAQAALRDFEWQKERERDIVEQIENGATSETIKIENVPE